MRPILALLICAVLAGCHAAAAPRPARPSAAIRVIDGDTIVVSGERVRLVNIDAPELPPHSKCWAEAALAVHASRMMQGYINEARTIRLERHGRDRYGRTLANVFSGDRDLGEALVGVGVAARWVGHRWDWCSPADLHDTNGPSLVPGPSVDDEFRDWVSEEEDHRLEEAARDAGWALKRQTPHH